MIVKQAGLTKCEGIAAFDVTFLEPQDGWVGPHPLQIQAENERGGRDGLLE